MYESYHVVPECDFFEHKEDVECICVPRIEARYVRAVGGVVIIRHRAVYPYDMEDLS